MTPATVHDKAYGLRALAHRRLRDLLRPGVKALLIAHLLGLVIWVLIWAANLPLLALTLQPEHGFKRFLLWQVVTFAFIVDPISLVYVACALLCIGLFLEKAWGTRRFVMYYLGVSAIAGITFALLGIVPFAGFRGPVYGLLAAFAVVAGRERFTIIVGGPLLKGWQLALLIGGLDIAVTLVFALIGSSGVLPSLFPPIVAGAAGYAYARFIGRRRRGPAVRVESRRFAGLDVRERGSR